jgi:hypothetical protein
MKIMVFLSLLIMLSGLSAFENRPTDFNVTSGKIEEAAGNRLQIRVPEFRATLRDETVQSVTVNFTYLGPTQEVFHLDNGEVRGQFGLKLRAKDICNLVYVMYHFDGKYPGINVSVKSNPGQSTSQQCKDNGYINSIPFRIKVDAPIIKVDEPHTLAAELDWLDLTVLLDHVVVWQGTLPNIPAASQEGPIGFRSDNAHILFDYKVGAWQ